MIRGHLEDKKTSLLLCLACFAAYSVVCMTRNSYSSAMAAIVQENLFSKADAGLINASFYLFYGGLQILGGYFADRYSPFKFILLGLSGCLLANIIMANTTSFAVMLIAWSFNGLSQFALWPSILKILSTVLMERHQKKALLYIAFGYSAGTLLSYLTATVFLDHWRWPSLFAFSSVVLICTIIFFLTASQSAKKKMIPNEQLLGVHARAAQMASPSKEGRILPLFWKSGLLILLFPAIIRCMLNLGVTSWVPTMMMESYGVSPGFASMLACVLLFINLSGILLVQIFYPKYTRNIALLSTCAFAILLIPIFFLFNLGTMPLIFATISLASITALMTGGNQLFDVLLPTAYSDYGRTGTVAGIVNTFACLGNVVANFLYGYLAEHFGWNVTILSWLLMAFVAILFSALAIPIWGRFIKKETVSQK